MLIVFLVLSAILIILLCVGFFFVNFGFKRGEFDFEKIGQGKNKLDPDLIMKRDATIKEGERWAYEHGFERVSVKSNDNLNLVGSLFRTPGSHKYAICIHGYRSTKSYMYFYAKMFCEHGYNSLCSDLRAHGESDGKYISFGYFDAQDQVSWINYIVNNDPQAEILIIGVSMGASTAMITSGLNLPDNVKCVVEDCGYSSAWALFKGICQSAFHIPSFPVLNISNLVCRVLCGFSIRNCSVHESLKKTKLPMLFIHGTEDSFVPFPMLGENMSLYSGPCAGSFIVEGAEHVCSILADQTEYEKALFGFAEKYFL